MGQDGFGGIEKKEGSGCQQAGVSLKGLVIALLGRDESARELGKRGTETDIAYYNSKKGDVVHTILYPSRYPQSIQPLGNILGISQEVVFDVQELGPSLGEQILAASHAGHKKAWLLLGERVGEDDVLPIFKDAGMEVFLAEDVRHLKQELEKVSPPERPNDGLTVVDQCFSVKGVGTVALGFVVSGSLKKHDGLVTSPGGSKCIVRSIQVQDEEQDEVFPFTRVGLALRGVEAEEVGKGSVLSSLERKSFTALDLDIDVSRYWKGKMEEGIVLHFSSLFQFSPGRVIGVTGNHVSINLEKPLVGVGERLLIFHLDSGKQRVVGSAVLA